MSGAPEFHWKEPREVRSPIHTSATLLARSEEILQFVLKQADGHRSVTVPTFGTVRPNHAPDCPEGRPSRSCQVFLIPTPIRTPTGPDPHHSNLAGFGPCPSLVGIKPCAPHRPFPFRKSAREIS